jgi:nucleoside-diphosphate-sugar epimerase
LPLDRLRAATPALCEAQDPYTNHIHADDLARIILATLSRGRAQRVYNASDGSWLKMGDYFDLVADRFGIPRPPRMSMEEAPGRVSPAALSFMRESRRLDNSRLRKELRASLRFPSVLKGIAAASARIAGAAALPVPS